MPIHPNNTGKKALRRHFPASVCCLAAAPLPLLPFPTPEELQPFLATSGLGTQLASLPVLVVVPLLIAVAMVLGYRIGARRAAQSGGEQFAGLLPAEAFRAAVDAHLANTGAAAMGGALIRCEVTGTTQALSALGATAEQSLMAEAWARLSALLPPAAMAGCSGHGTFLVFLPGEADPVAALSLARAITSALGQGFEVEGQKRDFACHGGIALAPKDGASADELSCNAELALAAAREHHTPGYGFFDPQAATAANRLREVQRAVAAAEAAHSFHLAFQPIHHMRSGELAGFEALLRLNDPELGNIPPSEFIPVAEQSGSLPRIGRWVLEEACRAAAQWPAHLVVSVNLSPVQFLTGTLVASVRDALEKHALPAYRLEVEITEGTLMKDDELVLGQLRILRDMGVGVALDDFGTGYSSLGYLWRFPFSKLKIDRSFVAALEQSASAKGILRSIVKLGRGLGMTVTAEGIENARQLGCLRDLGCDLAQGYFLGRPATEADLAPLIAQEEAPVFFPRRRAGVQAWAARRR